MKKFLHIASGAAKKTLYAAIKLAKKLTSLALQAAGSALAAAGKALKRPMTKLQGVLSPIFKIAMIASAALAALSCLGWLLTRKKAA